MSVLNTDCEIQNSCGTFASLLKINGYMYEISFLFKMRNLRNIGFCSLQGRSRTATKREDFWFVTLVWNQ